MKVADLINFSAGWMKVLSKHDIKMEDYKYVHLFEEYANLVANGHKVSYAVAMLACKYQISEASVYRIIKRLKTEL